MSKILAFDEFQRILNALIKICENRGIPVNWDFENNCPIDPTKDFSNGWDSPKKAFNLDIWYCSKPPQEDMTGVVDYVEYDSIPAEWIENSEEQ